MGADPGDLVEVRTGSETVRGILVQSPDSETVVVKLGSGYNVGIKKGNVTGIQAIQSSKAEKPVAKAVAKASSKAVADGSSNGLPKISILHTGGTIAARVDYKTGGVTGLFSADEMLALFPELKGIADIRSRKIMQLQSEMVRFPHYNVMAREIEKEISNGTDGIILTHGTDTLHYSSAALAFALENLPVPVILVGAQRSSDRGSTDAALNLISAAYFIANSDFAGVAICMHESISDTSCLILPATKTRKMHTSRRDAFRPINAKAIARVNYEDGKIDFLVKDYGKREKGKRENKSAEAKLQLKLFNEKLKVAIIKTHTNMYAGQFASYRGYDGLVLEGTGLGHIPNEQIDDFTAENRKIQEAVEELIKSGTVVVMSPQTIYGRIQMKVYTPQRELMDVGVLGHLSDMTPETAFIKLAWLLSNYSKEESRQLITKNLRGELADRTEEEAFLI